MKIRVIIPCFNEGKVVKTYDRLTEILTENSKTRRYYYDLLFIDDGSKDNTIEHIQHLAEYDEHVKYISFSRNFGKEAAMIAGFQHSVNFDAVVMIDGDLQHPPEFIPKMVEMYQQGFDQLSLNEIVVVKMLHVKQCQSCTISSLIALSKILNLVMV